MLYETCPYCIPTTGGHAADCPNAKSAITVNPTPHSPYLNPKGWECPKCGGVHAPFVQECHYCKPLLNPPIVGDQPPFTTFTFYGVHTWDS